MYLALSKLLVKSSLNNVTSYGNNKLEACTKQYIISHANINSDIYLYWIPDLDR